jgi:UDP-N-acetylmuramate--alanine ligase
VADWPGDANGFLEVRPRVSVLLNVGPAVEIDRDRWAGSLRRFATEVPDEGHLLALGHPSLLDDDRPLWEDGHPRREWISLTRGADWWGTDLREDKGRPRLRVFHRGRFVTELRLRVSGRANVVAALAAVAACDRLGISTAAVRQGVEEFNGLSRDFESRGSYRGVTLVDDEAEDAGSMRDALSLARRAFGGRRLWAVCVAGVEGAGAGQVDRFLKALSLADRVLILEPGAGPDPTSDRVGPSTGLSQALAEGGLKVCRAENLDGAISELDRHLEPGDVVLTLGAGDVGTIADAFIRRLSRDRQAG